MVYSTNVTWAANSNSLTSQLLAEDNTLHLLIFFIVERLYKSTVVFFILLSCEIMICFLINK